MTRAAEVLLASLIDYAGTFPPAGLTLSDAMAAYGRDRRSDHRWILGRFVVAAGKLEEFESIAPAVVARRDGCWNLTIVGTRESMPNARHISRFNETWTGRAKIVSLEFAPMPPAEIRTAAQGVPTDIDRFFEVALDSEIEASLAHIASGGARAKIRTGGVVLDAFPAAERLAHFFELCREARVGFKATAGLHHPVRGPYPLNYDADSPRTDMHGFLNVAAAAAFVHAGAARVDILRVLQESSAAAFVFTDEALSWRGRLLSSSQLKDARRRFFAGFGSCSFAEPVDELVRLGVVGTDAGAVARPHAEVP